MSQDENSTEQGSSHSAVNAAPHSSERFASRRRLIKLGGVAAPVALTLNSRPVMAWHCNTTSAWGSAQINPNQSTIARNRATRQTDETWTVANWKNNTTRAGLDLPWKALGLSFGLNIQTSDSKKPNYYKDLTVGWLFAHVGTVPVGLSVNDKLWDKISNGSQWQKYMIVARLNTRLVSNVKSCLTSSTRVDQLKLMATGTYTPDNLTGVVWSQAMIMQYLTANYIVVSA